MNHMEIRNGPPGDVRRPIPTSFQQHIDSETDSTKTDHTKQDPTEIVLAILRDDRRWFRGLTVAIENLGIALRKGVISPTHALELRDGLVVDDDEPDRYVEEFCTLVEKKRDQENRRYRRKGGAA